MPIHGPWAASFHDLGMYMSDWVLQLVHAWIAKFAGTCGHGGWAERQGAKSRREHREHLVSADPPGFTGDFLLGVADL